jgi:predicted ArsR family transcriptional regulator
MIEKVKQARAARKKDAKTAAQVAEALGISLGAVRRIDWLERHGELGNKVAARKAAPKKQAKKGTRTKK